MSAKKPNDNNNKANNNNQNSRQTTTGNNRPTAPVILPATHPDRIRMSDHEGERDVILEAEGGAGGVAANQDADRGGAGAGAGAGQGQDRTPLHKVNGHLFLNDDLIAKDAELDCLKGFKIEDGKVTLDVQIVPSQEDVAAIRADAALHQQGCSVCRRIATVRKNGEFVILGTVGHMHGHIKYRDCMAYIVKTEAEIEAYVTTLHAYEAGSIEANAKMFEFAGFRPSDFVKHHRRIFCPANKDAIATLATFVFLRGTSFAKALKKVENEEEARAKLTVALSRLGLSMNAPARAAALGRYDLTPTRVLACWPSAMLTVAKKYDSPFLPKGLPVFLRTSLGYGICTTQDDQDLCKMAAAVTAATLTRKNADRRDAVKRAVGAAEAMMASNFIGANKQAFWNEFGWSADRNAETAAVAQLRARYAELNPGI